MASPTPLSGAELIDCAKANENQGITAATQRCGYGEDVAKFESELKRAGDAIGVHIDSFSDLSRSSQEKSAEQAGVVVAPDTPSQL